MALGLHLGVVVQVLLVAHELRIPRIQCRLQSRRCEQDTVGSGGVAISIGALTFVSGKCSTSRHFGLPAAGILDGPDCHKVCDLLHRPREHESEIDVRDALGKEISLKQPSTARHWLRDPVAGHLRS